MFNFANARSGRRDSRYFRWTAHADAAINATTTVIGTAGATRHNIGG